MALRLKLLISSGSKKKEPRCILVGIMMLCNEVDTVFCDWSVEISSVTNISEEPAASICRVKV
jgi:hypothetical protein